MTPAASSAATTARCGGGGDRRTDWWSPAARTVRCGCGTRAPPVTRGRELGRHDGAVSAVAVTGEGRVVSGGADGTVRLWDPRNPG